MNDLTSTSNQGGVTMSTQANGVDAPTSTGQQENSATIETQCVLASPNTSQPPTSEPWNIDNVVSILTPPNSKRLSSALEGPPKRAKLDSNEILKQVNHQAEIIQRTINSSQASQDDKLREVHEAVEQNKQTIGNMQNELRQFMSAVASTLRDIQECLDD
ncbi:hypothetical protein TARUN_4748 [Trichoderma arundinaceum]|uniref:Uncharacterized protein n=1 Tax=Trichoderma arundinaceum TaxID=490622 RepID=A0A395NNN3_TRIAR|nr:hypothetical protein TARUN_4748 [Trichoderma arundinaceum]